MLLYINKCIHIYTKLSICIYSLMLSRRCNAQKFLCVDTCPSAGAREDFGGPQPLLSGAGAEFSATA